MTDRGDAGPASRGVSVVRTHDIALYHSITPGDGLRLMLTASTTTLLARATARWCQIEVQRQMWRTPAHRWCRYPHSKPSNASFISGLENHAFECVKGLGEARLFRSSRQEQGDEQKQNGAADPVHDGHYPQRQANVHEI